MRMNSEKVIQVIPEITNNPRIMYSEPMTVHLLQTLNEKLKVLIQSSSVQLDAYTYLAAFIISKVIPSVGSIIESNLRQANQNTSDVTRSISLTVLADDNRSLLLLMSSIQSLVTEIMSKPTSNTIH